MNCTVKGIDSKIDYRIHHFVERHFLLSLDRFRYFIREVRVGIAKPRRSAISRDKHERAALCTVQVIFNNGKKLRLSTKHRDLFEAIDGAAGAIGSCITYRLKKSFATR